MLHPAIFLDRDGTIVEEVHYLRHPDQLHLIAGAAGAIVRLRLAGFKLIVVTNQSGIARGYFSLETLAAIHHKLERELGLCGASLDGIYACYHLPGDGCDCRKPHSRLYNDAARDHAIDLRRSIMIGDKDTDLLAGKYLDMETILVRTGYGASQEAALAAWDDYQPSHIADDLGSAADWIISNRTQQRV
jgi:histidinol-phosphate phosphatase family protein